MMGFPVWLISSVTLQTNLVRRGCVRCMWSHCCGALGLQGCHQPILNVCESLSLESRAVNALGSI